MMATSEKNPALDGLVMLAILMLFMRHAAYGFFMINGILNHNFDPFLTVFGFDFYPLWANGWVGIDMIFAVCGYLIARMWYDDAASYKTYLIDQALKFLPLYYLVLLLCYVAIPFFTTPKPVDTWSVLYHLFFLPDVFEPGVNVAYAAVAAEIKFIIFLPLVFLALRSLRHRPLILMVLAAIFAVLGFMARIRGFSGFHATGDVILDYYDFFLNARFAFFYCLDPLMMGAGVAVFDAWSRGRLSGVVLFLRSIIVARIAFWAGFLLLLVWLGAAERLLVITSFDATWQPLLTGGIMTLMLYGAVMGGAPLWCRGRAARHIGHLAYPIYLIHIPLIQLSFVSASLLIYPFIPGAGLSALFWGFCFSYTCITYGVSVGLYWIERQFVLKTRKIRQS